MAQSLHTLHSFVQEFDLWDNLMKKKTLDHKTGSITKSAKNFQKFRKVSIQNMKNVLDPLF